MVDQLEPLTNEQRRQNVVFLLEAYKSAGLKPYDVLDADERRRFLAGDAREQRRLFFRLLCFGALAAQPAPEPVVVADWQRMLAAGLVDEIYGGTFDVRRFAVSPPVTRSDSKGKVIDFVRLAERREAWAALLPEPAEPLEVIDILHTASGGVLKSRAFWVVREMLRHGLWQPNGLARLAFLPDGRVRKRAARIGLIDLPEGADKLDDMKAVSQALHAAVSLAGNGARDQYDLPISLAPVRCEVCDTARLASCPMPSCRRRTAVLAG